MLGCRGTGWLIGSRCRFGGVLLLLGKGMVADNYRSVHGKGVACREESSSVDGHVFDLTVLSDPAEDQVVNLFC